MATKRHRVGKGKRMAGIFRSRASGQRAYVRTIVGDHVFITLEPQGSHGDMSLESFKRQYEKDK